MLQQVLVTGGAGYKGCVLVPKLLAKGYGVVVYDTLYYGSDGLPQHKNLKIVEGDIRDIATFTQALKGVTTVIHMACISNDPSFELDPTLSKSINYDCFEPMVAASKKAGVSRFIYVSSSSVYGVSESPDVTEEHPLVPLTDYNKYKGMCEPLLFKYQSPNFTTVTIRPATVSGYSPRTRLDLSVNILTNLAVNKGEITVFGGSQKRPNIHIEDVTDLYTNLVETPAALIAGETFNASEKNYTIADIAKIVKNTVEQEYSLTTPITVKTSVSNDLRSYHVSSKKIAERLGFVATRTVQDAARDLCRAFKAGKLPNSLVDDRYFNIHRMKKLSAE
jgi:nucleoside-diphosphate-sugar epimerase